MRTRTPQILLAAVLLLAAMTTLATATSIIQRTPEQLAQQSAIVVDGKVTGVRSYWNTDHTKIFTEATVAVDGTHKGSAASRVRVIQPGGVVDNVRMTAHGALAWKTGEEVLLFLESSGSDAYQVAGFSQGKYMIERDARTGNAYVRQAMPPDTRGATGPADASSASGPSAATTERVSLEQFLNRVLPQR
jgi:hypothetical protein